MKKLLIIDGHNYLYRSYYGIPSSAKLPNGLQINAYYGFFSLLRKINKSLNPSNILVVFDSETGISDKVNNNQQYKQNRDYSDTGMFKQLPIIKQTLDFINIPYIEHPKFEGDDVIGSIAQKESANYKVFISSQDKDFLQLINPHISLLRIEKGSLVNYTSQIFYQKYGFNNKRYLEYLSLIGDSSDNINGIKGIGPKTALKLISEDSDVMENPTNELLIDGIDTIKQNMEFLKINTSLKIDYSLKQYSKEKLEMNSNEILKKTRTYN